VRWARHLPTALVLVAAWIGLNGEVTWANVVAGTLVAVGLLAVVGLAPVPWHHQFHPVGFARFVGFVLWSLVLSSLAVARTVLWPTPERVRAGIVEVHLEDTSPLVLTMVANAITLTPGTITVTAQLRPAVLTVHVLGLGDLDEFRDSVADLQRRATAAFTPREGARA
jgi:multisubunit Na+/H+ antiporter MnhE subunit